MSLARVHEASTVLELGARGRHRGKPFTLAGRTCVRGSGGGLWNEWTVAFDDGRVAFLAEARGAFTLFSERPLVPSFDALSVGAPLDPGFFVVERGQAKRVARWGDAPEGPKTYRYADLSSRSGETATIDYGEDPPRVFVGARVRLADLGLRPRAERPRFLPVPSLAEPRGLELFLSLGDEGALPGGRADARFRVIGILQRSLRAGGERFTWEEYLLHEPAEGFRWLVVSDGHWNVVEPVEPGLVEVDERGGATYRGEAFRPLSTGTARVEWASGELPWEVAVGDTSEVADFVRAPHVLSREAGADEVTWSLGTWVPPEAIARAFGKRVLPKPLGRAPNQPKKPPAPRR